MRKNTTKTRRSRLTIILILMAINALTFSMVRIWWLRDDGLAMILEQHISDPDSLTMDYLIAGNLNQANVAFDFMKSKFGPNFTFVQFSLKGWDPEATAKRIEADILEHDYHARIFSISLGDHVARYLDSNPELDLEIYAINPCQNYTVLQEPLDQVLRYCSPVATAASHLLLGWASCLPVVPSEAENYSLILLLDQYWELYYDYPPTSARCTRGVICSEQDELLNNAVIETLYPEARIIYINTTHADIEESGQLYYDAVSSLLDSENAP